MIFGTLIIVVGIFLARIIANLVGSGTGEGGYAQTIVRYAIIALFTAIGLTFMGLADQIVMMAFGLILGSAAVATALAFGLGGRDAAARVARALGGPDRRRPARPAPPARRSRARDQRPGRQPAAAGVTDRFAAYVAIDWSGAKGRRHKGIAIAEARGDAAPRLVRPGHVWSREEVLAWLLKRAAREPTLFGFDFSFAPADRRARRISARRAGRAEDRARILGLCRREVRRRGPGRGELPRERAPQAFLFRHRRRGEGRLRPLPPVRRAAERAGRPQDRERL